MTEQFKRALETWLRKQVDHPVKEVLAFKQIEVEVPASFCGEGTCWETEVHVRIYYIRGGTGYSDLYEDSAEDFDYEGNYVEFIRDLTDVPDYMLS